MLSFLYRLVRYFFGNHYKPSRDVTFENKFNLVENDIGGDLSVILPIYSQIKSNGDNDATTLFVFDCDGTLVRKKGTDRKSKELIHPKTKEILETLKQDHAILICCSSATQDSTEEKLIQTGIREYFSAVIGQDTYSRDQYRFSSHKVEDILETIGERFQDLNIRSLCFIDDEKIHRDAVGEYFANMFDTYIFEFEDLLTSWSLIIDVGLEKGWKYKELVSMIYEAHENGTSKEELFHQL